MTRQAYSLDVLLAEVNKHAPNRDKGSDGGQARPEHTTANPTSDHEALDGVAWTARDFTDDPAHLEGTDLARRLAAKLGKHPAMGKGAYVIHNARIISYNRLDEGWRPYTGYNAHRTHVHLSVADARSAYDNKTAWNLWSEPVQRPEPTSTTPTLLDLDIALERLAKNTRGKQGAISYTLARPILASLGATSLRNRVPMTCAGVVAALDERRAESVGYVSDRLDSALALLRPLA